MTHHGDTDNNITTMGATYLANALAQHNCTLQQLHLDGATDGPRYVLHCQQQATHAATKT